MADDLRAGNAAAFLELEIDMIQSPTILTPASAQAEGGHVLVLGATDRRIRA